MTHDQTNAAVAASLGLAPSSAERHGVYPQRSLVRHIPVRGAGDVVVAHATVDADVVERFAGYRWVLNHEGYARRRQFVNGRNLSIAMHREIAGAEHGDRSTLVDHINHDRLDNRRCNLRLTTPLGNNQNSSFVRSRSGVRGVSATTNGKWKVQIYLLGRNIYGGTFDTLEDAKARYEELRRELHAERPEIFVPGAERTADDSRRVAPRVHARPGIQAGRDRRPGGPTPYPFQDECTCGHLAGDHQDSRSRSLTPAPPGLCLITDCDCDAFTHADEPVPHRIPHTPRHR